MKCLDPFFLVIGIVDFLMIIVDYFVMKPRDKDTGLGYRIFSAIIGIACILFSFV